MATAALVTLCASLALAAPATCLATDFRIDPDRSHAEFGVRLLWVHTISGRFARIGGDIRLDRDGLATVDARLASATIAMGSERFRRWVMAPEFFDAARYPTIHFLSDPIPLTRLTTGGPLNGQLSLRGLTRPVRFELLPATCAAVVAQGCRIEARGLVSRSAFGMTSHRTALSDQVQLALSIVLDPARD